MKVVAFNTSNRRLRLINSVFIRIKFVLPCHCHTDRCQRMQHADRARMVCEHVGQAPVGHRALVEIGADQHHAVPARVTFSTAASQLPMLPHGT